MAFWHYWLQKLIEEQAGYVYNVDIAIGTYQLVNELRAHRGKACFLIWLYKLLYMRSMLTQQSSTSGTDCHTVLVGLWFQLQETVSAGTGSPGVSCLLSLCWTIIPAVWWSDSKKRNRTMMSLYRRVFMKLNILHWTPCTVNWSVTYFLVLYKNSGRYVVYRLCFWLLVTYLVISHTTLTYMSEQKRHPGNTIAPP